MPQRHLLVAVVIFVLENNGRYLLHLRKNTGFMDDMWSLPGGHVEAGEHVLQAVMREAREELGIEVTEDALHFLGLHHVHRSDGLDGINLYYKITSWKGEPFEAEPEYSGGLQWFAPSEFPININPEIYEVLEEKPPHMAVAGRYQARIGQHN